MIIDPRLQFPTDSQPEPLKNTRTSGATAQTAANNTGTKPAVGEDTVSISSTHSDIQTLTSNLANVPEVRTHRIDALQQSVTSGQYKPDSQKVADAILADPLSGVKFG
ncbi:MAG TPA: flagellar biosynthesis anti-sigma factor FlgM [Candidatus Acidoferrum sp.]|jgi:flagellar biosynthesis anti-sigma factor FlgM